MGRGGGNWGLCREIKQGKIGQIRLDSEGLEAPMRDFQQGCDIRFILCKVLLSRSLLYGFGGVWNKMQRNQGLNGNSGHWDGEEGKEMQRLGGRINSILAQWLALEGGWKEGRFWYKWVNEVIVHLLTDWASPGDEQPGRGTRPGLAQNTRHSLLMGQSSNFLSSTRPQWLPSGWRSEGIFITVQNLRSKCSLPPADPAPSLPAHHSLLPNLQCYFLLLEPWFP